MDANDLIEAYNRSRRLSGWKASTQRFGASLLLNCLRLADSIADGTYEQRPFTEFMQHERGKPRPIRAMHIRDRIVQRALCDTVLIPALRPQLIYDNGASLKGKGVEFTRKRLLCHLQRYWRKHGAKGWVLQIDFSKFFDNIPHAQVLERLASIPSVAPHLPLIRKLLRAFQYDVSYGFDPSTPFDTARHREIVQAGALQDGSVILERSVGIGSQISQVIGVWYPTPLDTWCKCALGIHGYGRYMDDVYILHEDKAFLKDVVLPGFAERARKLGLFVNPKKTHIRPLSAGFTFLKFRYRLTPTGKVEIRHPRATFVRMRRRLKKLWYLVDVGRVTPGHVELGYLSWRGTVAGQRDNARTLAAIDNLYTSLFGGQPWVKKPAKKR